MLYRKDVMLTVKMRLRMRFPSNLGHMLESRLAYSVYWYSMKLHHVHSTCSKGIMCSLCSVLTCVLQGSPLDTGNVFLRSTSTGICLMEHVIMNKFLCCVEAPHSTAWQIGKTGHKDKIEIV